MHLDDQQFERLQLYARQGQDRQEQLNTIRGQSGYDEDPGLEHPENPARYFRTIGLDEVWNLRVPLPGVRIVEVLWDGRLGPFSKGRTSAPAECTFNWNLGTLAPQHNPRCACGYRICADMSALGNFWLGEQQRAVWRKLVIEKPDAVAKLAPQIAGYGLAFVLATGHAVTRCEKDLEPRGTLRVETLTLTGLSIPDEWVRASSAAEIRRSVSQRYGLPVQERSPELSETDVQDYRETFALIGALPPLHETTDTGQSTACAK